METPNTQKPVATTQWLSDKPVREGIALPFLGCFPMVEHGRVTMEDGTPCVSIWDSPSLMRIVTPRALPANEPVRFLLWVDADQTCKRPNAYGMIHVLD